jgi:hypothetical protein
MEILSVHKSVVLTTLIDLADVKKNWPERYGHLVRIARLVESVVELGLVRVEMWDGGLDGCQGVYVPSCHTVRLWADSPVLALTLVHELGHSLMRVGSSWWSKWESDSYLSDPEELYARAFTQYVAVKTEDRVLCSQLESVREFHWSADEFSKIMENGGGWI